LQEYIRTNSNLYTKILLYEVSAIVWQTVLADDNVEIITEGFRGTTG